MRAGGGRGKGEGCCARGKWTSTVQVVLHNSFPFFWVACVGDMSTQHTSAVLVAGSTSETHALTQDITAAYTTTTQTPAAVPHHAPLVKQ